MNPYSNEQPMSVFFNDFYCRPAINFETVKKAAKIASSIKNSPELRSKLRLLDPADDPHSLSSAIEEIERYVEADYLTALHTGEPIGLAASNELGWDLSLYDMVVHSTAGILSALAELRRGRFASASLSSGLHHATPSHGAGFCTVNSLAIAALVAAREGLRVAVLDLDAHCGGGTNEYFRTHPQESQHVLHVDVAISAFDHYQHPTHGSFFELANENNYLEVVRRALGTLTDFNPELVIYNAGVDIWPRVSKDMVRQRDQMTAKTISCMNSRCLTVLAGGYGDDKDIVPLHLGTLEEISVIELRSAQR
jgi:acetoin utilization deacetylase AcuC-like enzyme